MKQKQKKEKKAPIEDTKQRLEKKNTIGIIIIFILLIAILLGVSLAKYQSTLRGKAMAMVAEPILEIKREQSLLVTALEPKASYVFQVNNYNEEQVNEVEMEYYIEIITKTDEAIKFNLYQGDTEIPLIQNKTQWVKLTTENKETHRYQLDITYEKGKGNTQQDINENVEIKIHSIQKA